MLGLVVNGGAIARSVEAGSNTSLLVTGNRAADVFSIDDNATPSTSSTQPARLRLVNGIAGSAALTVDNAQLADSVASGTASPPSNVSASAVAAVLAVTSAGGVVTTLSAQTLVAGRVYSLFLLADAAGKPTLTLSADR